MERNRDYAIIILLRFLAHQTQGKKPSQQEGKGLPASELEGQDPVLEYPALDEPAAKLIQMPLT